MSRKIATFIFILLTVNVICNAQIVEIKWNNNINYTYRDDSTVKVLNFENAKYSPDNAFLPFMSIQTKIKSNNYDVIFLPDKVSIIDKDSLSNISGIDNISENFNYSYNYLYQKKQPTLNICVTPVRFNKSTGNYEKLISFNYFIVEKKDNAIKNGKNISSNINSVLATGNWYKFLVPENGFYKITFQELVNWGIDLSTVNPKTIKIYGNGGRMLPEANSKSRYDDLHEIPIQVVGEDDGNFNNGDYILFYGDGPDKWEYNTSKSMYLFVRNLYTRNAGYFLTYGGNNGKRMEYETTTTETAGQILTTFMDYLAYEPCLYHLTKSGKDWYGDRFDSQTQYSYSFSFPDIVTDKKVLISYNLASRAFISSSYFTVKSEDFTQTHFFNAVGTTLSSYYANQITGYGSLNATSSSVPVTLSYTKSTSSAIGWVRFIYLNAYRKLNFTSGTLFFRYPSNQLTSNIVDYQINTSADNLIIADITNPVEPLLVNYTDHGSYINFTEDLSTNREFVCFDGTSTKSVTSVGKINNQNIHGMSSPDMVIVYNSNFEEAAKLLYDYHNSKGLVTYMIDKDIIFNEFSSGVQDVCAIRDMMRYWYNNADESKEPKYLLLVGDASYDPLDRMSNNTNFIPVYESKTTLDPSYSYCSDDFYGFMDENEGSMSSSDLLDISVGRLPVQTKESAMQVVKKILHYASNTSEQMGDWKNIVTLVCDDSDNIGMGYEYRHLESAEKYASIIEDKYKSFKINKIYSGAYKQTTAAGGQRYPEVNDAINARLEQGTLVLGYNGHGGEICLALEQIVTIPDINSWSNYDRLAFILTATCEFSRYDDPARTSAGELVILNPNGGAFSMLTTSRLTDSGTNLDFCSLVYSNMFKKNENNEYPTVGEFVMNSKNDFVLSNNSFINITPYVIFGDPAISINYPKYNSVDITKVTVDNTESDTINALSKVNIKGHINDNNGNILSNFNGTIYPELRDKPTETSTLGNDGADIQYFYVDKSIIYKGKVQVTNGTFNMTFITPKDITYNFGAGKANFYFTNDTVDGNGYFNQYVVGGSNDVSISDNEGPDINMYINDKSFVDGDITNEDPSIFATLYDKSGINTIGNGIGHDITAILDNNTERIYILNTYFEADINSYQSGTISYPLFNLDEGHHTLTFKAWDILNNSSSSTINFVVVNSDNIKLTDLFNYPNPFKDYTTFALKHNQAGQTLNVDIYIYSTDGRLVKHLTSSLKTDSFENKIINWDGKNYNGNDVPQGIYIYKVVITNENGNKNHASGKLVKL